MKLRSCYTLGSNEALGIDLQSAICSPDRTAEALLTAVNEESIFLTMKASRGKH